MSTRSRETSPSRSVSGFGSVERRLSAGSASGGRQMSPTNRNTPFMAEKILQQSQEAESAMADVLQSLTVTTRKRYNAYDDQSDESETSSICSDISYGSYPGRKIEVNSLSLRFNFHCLKPNFLRRKFLMS